MVVEGLQILLSVTSPILKVAACILSQVEKEHNSVFSMLNLHMWQSHRYDGMLHQIGHILLICL